MKLMPVAGHLRPPAGGQLDPAIGSGGARVGTGPGSDRGQINGLLYRLANLVEPREREELVDEDAHPAGLLLDPAHRLLELLRVARRPEPERLGVAANGGERGAELVGGVGQEAAEAVLTRLPVGEGHLDLT